jgi:hypothetical protein
MRNEIKQHATDEFWQMAGLIQAQFDGQVDGYNAVWGDVAPLTRFHF